jgi:signal transduction histidine kinase
MHSLNTKCKNDEYIDSEAFNSTLISILAHDLRQPFATIVMLFDMMTHTKRFAGNYELQTSFAELRNVSLQSIGLLDGLLYWMKSKNEGYPYQAQSLRLLDLISEANELYVHDQKCKAITLYKVIPESQTIFGHKQMLQFINRNILSNATKYSPEQGVIGVTSTLDDNSIIVAFTDQGMGMTTKQLDDIFEVKDKIATQGYLPNAAGIAMSICRDMINFMGGEIWVKSQPGEGTVFYYSLPFINKT